MTPTPPDPTGEDILAILGRNIRRARNDRNIASEALAAKARLSGKTFSMVEQGKSDPHVTSVAKIAAALGVSLAALFDVTPPAKAGKP